jgi:hypothetical protein
MRRFMATLCCLAALGLTVNSAHAGYTAMDWEYNTSTSPTATTNGLWWVNTGSGPTLLNFDVNAELLGGLTQSNIVLLYAGSNPAIFLVSDRSGWGGYGDIANNGDGLFCPGASYGYLIPGTAQDSSETAWFEVKAWTGDYPTYEAAYAASGAGQAVYVADVIFQNPTGPVYQVPTQSMTNSPAIVLDRGLAGDANIDGKVDINDLTRVLTNYNQTTVANGWGLGDFNGDEKVDINDLTIVLSHYNQSIGASAGGNLSTVPEPSGLVLLVAGLLGLVVYARGRQE